MGVGGGEEDRQRRGGFGWRRAGRQQSIHQARYIIIMCMCILITYRKCYSGSVLLQTFLQLKRYK